MLLLAFPDRELKPEDRKARGDLYRKRLDDLTDEQWTKAVNRCLDIETFFPTIAVLRGHAPVDDRQGLLLDDAPPPSVDAESQELLENAVMQLKVPPASFETWWLATRGVGQDAAHLDVWCPSEVHVSWIRNCWGERLNELLAPRRLKLIHGAVGGGA